MPWAATAASFAACAAAAGSAFAEPAAASDSADVPDWRTEPDIPNPPKPPEYDWPPFTNWDCISTPKAVLDWDDLYDQVVRGISGESGNPSFVLPEVAVRMLLDKPMQAREECPMGTLYFLTLYTYEVVMNRGGPAAVAQANSLVMEMRQYPFIVIAGARWPTYEAFNHFSWMHMPQNPKAAKNTLCEGVRGPSGIDWDALLEASHSWSDEQLSGLEPGEGTASFGRTIKAAADQVYKDPQHAGKSAQDECAFGFLWLCTTQVLAACMRLTGALEPWARAVDKILAELPYYTISGSQWPTFRMLAMLSSFSKGDEVRTLGNFQGDVHRWGGKHPVAKRFRHYGDLRLTVNELAPLGRHAEGWRLVDKLVNLDAGSWYTSIISHRLANVRRIYGEALDAALVTIRAAAMPLDAECGFSGITPDACQARGCRWAAPTAEADWSPSCQQPRSSPPRKVVFVTFVWGESWAPLVPRFAGWAAKLRLHTIIVGMGEACRRACEFAVMSLSASSGIACWDPLRGSSARHAERGSIVQRHAMVHILLHLGIDVVAFDFDTFFFLNPLPRLEALANEQGADILMARHLDADCLNMGLIYIRASSRTAEWYSKYLEWFQQHVFEREQRGINALLKFTNQSVSFPPSTLPAVKGVALDDYNEFASSRGGWLGDFDKLIFFHWVNPVRTMHHWGEIKIDDLRALYDSALHPGTDIRVDGAEGSLAKLMAKADDNSMLGAVRNMMNSMRVDEAPIRQACW